MLQEISTSRRIPCMYTTPYVYEFVILNTERQTDGQTDRQTDRDISLSLYIYMYKHIYIYMEHIYIYRQRYIDRQAHRQTNK